MKKLFYLIGLLFLLVACGTESVESTVKDTEPRGSLPPAESEVTEGDFIYRLYTEKDVYDEFGDLAIFAELTYTGEKESIDIYHGESAFFFPIAERTREFEVDYAMNEPLLTTTLEKDVPFRQTYNFAGGYSDTDPVEFQNFVKTIIEKGFPEGEYVMHGSAQFYTTDPADANNNEMFNMNATIGFTVMKGASQ